LDKAELKDVQLIIKDDDAFMKAAGKAIFGSILWQRCQLHLQQKRLGTFKILERFSREI
jgi:hypothetical protein